VANYNFRKDLPVAKRTEKQVSDYLVSRGYGLIDECNNSDYDIRMQRPSGEILTIEVKEDFMCKKTSNVAVEYYCRGKPSGISVSKADIYIYKVHEPNGQKNMYAIKTSNLKKMVEDKLYHREVSGGDKGSDSRNYLFKLNVIKDNFSLIGRLEE
jgi:hypothetical protein